MMRVISSPSISTTGLRTLILLIARAFYRLRGRIENYNKRVLEGTRHGSTVAAEQALRGAVPIHAGRGASGTARARAGPGGVRRRPPRSRQRGTGIAHRRRAPAGGDRRSAPQHGEVVLGAGGRHRAGRRARAPAPWPGAARWSRPARSRPPDRGSAASLG